MGVYLARRVVASLLTVLLLSFAAFFFIVSLPGDPADLMLGEYSTPERAAQVRHLWGLDKPFLVRYEMWLLNIVQGRFGESLVSQVPIESLLRSAFPVSLELCLLGLAFGCALGVPVGLLATVVPRFLQRPLMVGALAMQAIPSFVTGLLLILLVSVKLRLLPPSAYVPLSVSVAQNLKSMLLPTVSLGLVLAGTIARFTRACVLDALQSEYVRTARSKGLSEAKVLVGHALRAGLIPLVSLIGTQVVWLLGGSILQEMIFVLPGMGRLVVESVFNRDYLVIQAVVLVMAVVVAVSNLLVDLTYGLLDPRIRYE